MSACAALSMPSAITSTPKRVAQPDDRAVQRLDPSRLRADGKAAVELDDLHGQRVQICQRAVARAEVVEGDLDPDRVEPGDLRSGVREVDDRNRLGDLQDELARRQPAAIKRPLHFPFEFEAAQPRRADVHVQDHVDACGFQFVAGEVEHHRVERRAQPCGLGGGDECVGLDVGAIGRGPPRERLDCDRSGVR